VAIVSVWGPQHRVPRERLSELGRRSLEAAAEIKRLLA
jgi:DNA-binding IclR family transcriptional regulator